VKVGEGRKMAIGRVEDEDESRNARAESQKLTGLWLHLLSKYV
jgi:hypothetical protein